MLNASNEQMCDLIAGHGMEWNVNFGMKYGRCQNGMDDNLPYFHTNSTLDVAHGIYRKIRKKALK